MTKSLHLRDYLTITSSKDGNSKERLHKQKLVSFGKQSSFKYVDWAKVFTSPASPPFPTTTSAILLHSLTLIFLSCARLLAVEDVTKLINP